MNVYSVTVDNDAGISTEIYASKVAADAAFEALEAEGVADRQVILQAHRLQISMPLYGQYTTAQLCAATGHDDDYLANRLGVTRETFLRWRRKTMPVAARMALALLAEHRRLYGDEGQPHVP
jgi:hypothetical protein